MTTASRQHKKVPNRVVVGTAVTYVEHHAKRVETTTQKKPRQCARGKGSVKWEREGEWNEVGGGWYFLYLSAAVLAFTPSRSSDTGYGYRLPL